jgi:diacylglycerol O-acyltransferase
MAAARRLQTPGCFPGCASKLGTDIADPVQRLAAIRDLAASSDVMAPGGQRARTAEVVQFAPSAAIAATSKLLRSASALLGNWTPLANCAIANVPGPRVPLYLQGARLSYLSAIMPIADGMGLVFSVTSYSGMLDRFLHRCYEQLPDPGEPWRRPARQLPGIPGAGPRRRGASRA